jgi:WD40 repeat protein
MSSEPVQLAESVRALAWVDAATCVVGDAEGAVSRWRIRDDMLERLDHADGRGNGCTAVAVDPTDGRVALGWESGKVRIHRDTPAVELCLREAVSSLAFAPGGGPLAIAAGHDVLVVDADGSIVVGEWYRRGAAVCLCWLDDTLLAIGGRGGVSFLAAVDVPVLDLPASLPSPGVVLDLQLDAARTLLTASDLRGEVRITDLRTGDELSLDGHGDRVQGAVWFDRDRLLAVASDDELTVWERAPVDLEPEPWVHGPVIGPSTTPTVSSDSTKVAVGGHDGTVLVVGARRRTAPSVSVQLDDAITAVSWCPDGDGLAVGTASGELRMISC